MNRPSQPLTLEKEIIKIGKINIWNVKQNYEIVILLIHFLHFLQKFSQVHRYHLHNYQVKVTKQTTRHFNQMQPLIAREPNDVETRAGANDHFSISCD